MKKKFRVKIKGTAVCIKEMELDENFPKNEAYKQLINLEDTDFIVDDWEIEDIREIRPSN